MSEGRCSRRVASLANALLLTSEIQTPENVSVVHFRDLRQPLGGFVERIQEVRKSIVDSPVDSDCRGSGIDHQWGKQIDRDRCEEIRRKKNDPVFGVRATLPLELNW